MTSLPNNKLIDIGSRLAGTSVTAMTSISKGGNSRSFRLDCASGERYFMKCYPRSSSDQRDRIGAEIAALSFLNDNNLECVPKIHAHDALLGVALLEWIGGSPIDEPSIADLDTMIEFIRSLKDLSGLEKAQFLPDASEACFSGDEIVDQIRQRLDRFTGLKKSEPELATFLELELTPIFVEVEKWARAGLSSFHDPVSDSDKTLSPSDFGFHNTIRRPDGRIVVIDFEYFGWDDPIKLIADFVLHPAMSLTPEFKQKFVAEARLIFNEYSGFLPRLKYFLALYDLRWCMIQLNPFDPQYWQSRFAQVSAVEHGQIKSARLKKTRQRLAQLKIDYQNMEYDD